jgi:ribosomal protein S18 acetylase RimI-like enzyme
MSSIDEIRARLRLGPAVSDDHPQIEPLTPEAARDLRLPWLSRFAPDTLDWHLRDNPDMALWVPRTGEYVIAEPWRRRDEIASIVEVTARRGRPALIRELVEGLRARGYRLVILSDEVWRDQPRVYQDLGFERVETIVFFQKTLKWPDPYLDGVEARFPSLQYTRLDSSDVDLLLDLDRSSFPWLWWNSRAELENYLHLPGVYAYSAESEGEPIGYFSFTMYQGWAHLDRLAVTTAHQGRKYGAAQLFHALHLMTTRGAASVALSTQATNYQSHRLYKGFGFKQTSEKMDFYGIGQVQS